MNSEFIGWHKVNLTVSGYDDGVYNLELHGEIGDIGQAIEISKEEAERICEFLGEDLPNPEPTKPIEFK